MTVSDVIVLNPVDDSVCNLQCAVGWYHEDYGNAAPFSCAANIEDRTSREGIPTYPISCSGAFFVLIMECCSHFNLFLLFTRATIGHLSINEHATQLVFTSL